LTTTNQEILATKKQ
jgi:hypothetical protein